MLCQSCLFILNRGLTSVFRPKAGHHFEKETDDNKDPDYWNNLHWLSTEPDAAVDDGKEKRWFPGPSNFVHYYDATSLYPSSGKLYFKKQKYFS